jgi:hypothetical protein
MSEPKPIGTLVVDGRTVKEIKLALFEETEWLAITREDIGFQITHKPTGMRIPRCYEEFSVAKKVMNALAGLDWDWGHRWNVETKRKISGASLKSSARRGRSRDTLMKAQVIVKKFDRAL